MDFDKFKKLVCRLAKREKLLWLVPGNDDLRVRLERGETAEQVLESVRQRRAQLSARPSA
jgi:hypothetical protein